MPEYYSVYLGLSQGEKNLKKKFLNSVLGIDGFDGANTTHS